MNPGTLLRPNRTAAMQARHTDVLASNHFDQAFFIFNVFVDDARTCMDLADGVFRGLDAVGGTCEREFYQTLVRQVRELPCKNEVVPGHSPDNVLCWLFKDLVDFNYAEISGLMGLSREQVRDAIASVRMAVLD